MNIDYIKIAELVGSAIIGGWLSRILTIRSRVRQENANASKAETAAKKEQLEIIQELVDSIYKPTIEDLKKDVQDLRKEVHDVREENEKLKNEVSEVRRENAQLREENTKLRRAIREISPSSLPSERGTNAATQPRTKNGHFAKKQQ